MNRVPRRWIAGALCLLCALASSGCFLRPKTSLREAEDLGRLWVADLMGLLDPKPPPPPKVVKGRDGKPRKAKRPKSPPRSPNPEIAALVAPKTLRDCFVSDGWSPDGFKNPTEAICWLTGRKLRLVRIASIERNDKGAEVTVELTDGKPQTLVAQVTTESGAARCLSLTLGKPKTSSG